VNAPTIDDWDTCYAVNVKAQIFLMREALATFNANPEGGVFIITSSIAGRIPGGSSKFSRPKPSFCPPSTICAH
jgi:NADP-dependent 3-hydroxy acid dehydrogenase YdfG